MKPVYLDTVAGHYHPPTGTPSGTAVLLVPPFGWDDQCTYRPRYDWAVALAAAGHAALRIDLPGTGDSGGGPHDPDILDAWTAAVRAGVDHLRGGRVAVIALGLGGLIALRAAPDVDDLVLWATAFKGRTPLRELQAFGRLEASQTGEDTEDVPAGEIRAGGHVMSAATAAAVKGLDAGALLAGGGPARALVMGRDGTGPDEGLVDALRATGAAVATDRGAGWGAAGTAPPSTSPTALFATVNAWLAQAAPGGPAPAPAPLPDSVVLGAPGARVRETPVRFDGGSLFGIVCEPVDVPREAGTVVLLNAGAIRHVGPNRMWTESARRWAARGVPVVRVDLEGIGDSDGDPAPYIDTNTLHTTALVDQARAALTLATDRGLPDRFLVGGMCSGGYWAFQTMLADPRVVGAATLNQRVLIFDPFAEAHREVGRFLRVFTPQGFRYMLMGDRKLLRLWRMITFVAATPVRKLRGRRQARPATDPLTDALRLLHERGQTLDMGFSAEEPLHDQLREQPRLAELEDAGVGLYELPYISHTLKPVGAQRAAGAFLDDVVDRTFPPTA